MTDAIVVFMTAANADLEVWEHHIESELDRDTAIPTTEREALIIARRGQGVFKERVNAGRASMPARACPDW